jgi:hypothetical protein
VKRPAAASSVVALASLIGGFAPASALEICTTPDGALYVGDTHPENCVPRDRLGRPRRAVEDEPAAVPSDDAPVAARSYDESIQSESSPPPLYDAPSAKEPSDDSAETERALESAKQAELSREQHDQLFHQVSALRVTRGPQGLEIAGAFRNDLGRLLTYVRLDFQVLGEDGKPIDSAIASTSFLGSGETWSFSASTARPDARGARLVDVSTSD